MENQQEKNKYNLPLDRSTYLVALAKKKFRQRNTSGLEQKKRKIKTQSKKRQTKKDPILGKGGLTSSNPLERKENKVATGLQAKRQVGMQRTVHVKQGNTVLKWEGRVAPAPDTPGEVTNQKRTHRGAKISERKTKRVKWPERRRGRNEIQNNQKKKSPEQHYSKKSVAGNETNTNQGRNKKKC